MMLYGVKENIGNYSCKKLCSLMGVFFEILPSSNANAEQGLIDVLTTEIFVHALSNKGLFKTP